MCDYSRTQKPKQYLSDVQEPHQHGRDGDGVKTQILEQSNFPQTSSKALNY